MRCAWTGACSLCHGSMPQLSPLARQNQRQDLPQRQHEQGSALLFILLMKSLACVTCALPVRHRLVCNFCNGHSELVQSLKREGIGFAHPDNAFLRTHPLLDEFGQSYHWNIRQIEYSTDLKFKSTEILTPLYDCLSRQSFHRYGSSCNRTTRTTPSSCAAIVIASPKAS